MALSRLPELRISSTMEATALLTSSSTSMSSRVREDGELGARHDAVEVLGHTRDVAVAELLDVLLERHVFVQREVLLQ